MSSYNFPADLFPDILSRLPVNTLLKFKYVSKLWLSIIEDPKFSSVQAKRFSDSSSITQIFQDRRTGICEINFSCCGVDAVDVVIKKLSSLPEEILHECPKLVGSSNGVLCLVDYSNVVILWNPLSKKYQCLPPLPHAGNFGPMPMSYYYGFGYDNVNNDYKVLCFETPNLMARHYLIYTRKLNTWRRRSLDKFPISFLLGDSGVLFGGSLHWICGKHSSPHSLIAFDLSNEEFKRFSLPSPGVGGVEILQDGCFYQLVPGEKWSNGIRIMLKYNWCKELRIERARRSMLLPIAYVKRPREFVIMCLGSSDLVFYDVEKQSLIDCDASNINGYFFDKAFPYIQTLELY